MNQTASAAPSLNKTTIIILTQMRSGSTFTGHLLSHLPNSYLTHEPISTWRNISLTDTTYVADAIAFLRDVIRCKFKRHQSYTSNRKKFKDEMREHYCMPSPSLSDIYDDTCDNIDFLQILCNRSSVHILKVIALRLRHLFILLNDKSINIKVIHLIRDPRATIASARKIVLPERYHGPNFYCSHIREDLAASKYVKKLYPDR